MNDKRLKEIERQAERWPSVGEEIMDAVNEIRRRGRMVDELLGAAEKQDYCEDYADGCGLDCEFSEDAEGDCPWCCVQCARDWE